MAHYNHPKIILHVDDDADDRFLVDDALKSIDPNIILHQVHNGKKALEFLNQAKLLNDLPCLIILDMNMPVMNGYDTFKAIKNDAALSRLPIVLFTTSINNKEAYHWEKENVRMIIKPASFNEFIERIKTILAHFAAHQKLY
jgi:CheY-like chemotaxis protein